MTDTLALVSLTDAQTLANSLAPAETLPAALRKKPADVLLAILSGRSLGLDPTQSIRAIHVIEGRVTLSADAMAAICKRSPQCEYLQCTESTDKVATFVTQRKGEPKPTTMSFTIEEATRAGLVGKGNWAKFPKAMLRARALAALCRLTYPDLLLGTYDPDELDTPAERDVTPARPAADTSKPDGVEAMKRRMRVVDAATGADVRTPPPSPPAPPAVEDPTTVGWGKNAAAKLAELSADKVQWYLDDATKKATDNADDERELWAGRAARYRAALARVTEVAS